MHTVKCAQLIGQGFRIAAAITDRAEFEPAVVPLERHTTSQYLVIDH